MRVAVPVRDGAFCTHFGRAEGFLLCDVDAATRQLDRPRVVTRRKKVGCESVPDWLQQMAVTAVVAGGIGGVARQHLAALGIAVSAGHVGTDPQEVARAFLAAPAAHHDNPCSPLLHRRRHCRR